MKIKLTNTSDVVQIEQPNGSIIDIQELQTQYNTLKEKITFNGYDYVDLGLPSGTLWATCNVGASAPTQTGLYFAWGETDGHLDGLGTKTFSWNDYKFGAKDTSDTTNYGMKKYNGTDSKVILDKEDDAAHVIMGGEWRIPTVEQFEELCDPEHTTYSYTSDYKNTGISGMIFESNYWDGELFFPVNSYYSDGVKTSSPTYLINSIYPQDITTVNIFGFQSDPEIGQIADRNRGYNIRPVVGAPQ